MAAEAKVCLVTGATAGFGVAIAKRFHQEGWRVIITGRREDRLKALQAELGADKCHFLTFDVRDKEAVTRAVESLPAEWSVIDVLVNNAGLAIGSDPVDNVAPEDMDLMVDTNCKGLFYCTRAIVPGMVTNGKGHIINIGSVAGVYPYPGGNVYCATKAFVKQLSICIRADLVGKNIRCTDIEPGIAETEFSQVRFRGDADKAAAVYKDCEPLTSENIAEATFWAANQPKNVNINRIELMASCQGFGGLTILRDQ